MMRTINILTVIGALILFINCSNRGEEDEIMNKKIIKQQLDILKVDDYSFLIPLPTKDTAKIISNPDAQITTIEGKKSSLNLSFFIAEPYIGNAYWYRFENYGNALILESNIVGASGLSASITNVSVVFFKSNVPERVISYNSFFSGAELIREEDRGIILNILNLNEHQDDTPVYCLNQFALDNNFLFKKVDVSSRCYIPKKQGLEIYKKCNECEKIERPFVIE